MQTQIISYLLKVHCGYFLTQPHIYVSDFTYLSPKFSDGYLSQLNLEKEENLARLPYYYCNMFYTDIIGTKHLNLWKFCYRAKYQGRLSVEDTNAI